HGVSSLAASTKKPEGEVSLRLRYAAVPASPCRGLPLHGTHWGPWQPATSQIDPANAVMTDSRAHIKGLKTACAGPSTITQKHFATKNAMMQERRRAGALRGSHADTPHEVTAGQRPCVMGAGLRG